jgi:uncharacterized radical SAM superfamily protein
MEPIEKFEKKLEAIDTKLDTLIMGHQGVYKDVEWLKGSLKIALILVLPAILTGMGWLFSQLFSK